MTRLRLPKSPDELLERLKQLHGQRTALVSAPRRRRLRLTAEERALVLAKTAARCHLCGGIILEEKFAADHVLSHAAGGAHAVDNYLPAHHVCNGCRWFYSPEEVQWIMKMGVWARKQMEGQTLIGQKMMREFWKHETATLKRRRSKDSERIS